MGGLIPLLLQPAAGDSRNSIIFPTRGTSLPPSPRAISPAPSQQPLPSATHLKRPSSLIPTSRDQSPQQHLLLSKPLPSRPQSIIQPKKKMLKRFSNLPPGNPLVVPTTNTEWKKTVAEVKRLHGSRRYRLCSARCCEILAGIKDMSRVEPAYLIYLHFYAASSLEMAARPILTTSPLRVKLLEQARSHYSSAATLIQAAEDSAVAKSRSSSVASTATFSRQHSPSGSVSSRSGTPSTDISSPGCVSSMFTPPGPPPNMVAPSPPVKKKVSFYMPVPEEPMVRPDSPTLGFDDFEAIENASRDLPPLPPQPSRLSILKPARPFVETTAYPGHAGRTFSVSSFASSSAGTMTTASTAATSPDSYITSASSAHASLCGSLEFDSNVYRTLSRFCSHLDGLRSQVAYHVAAVDAELTTCTHSPTYDPSTSRPRSAMSNDGGRPGSRGSVSSDGIPLEDLNDRLERLRANGWKRPRFDPHRYEVLRERVLEELSSEN